MPRRHAARLRWPYRVRRGARLLPDPTGASTVFAPRSRLRALEFAVQPSLRLLCRVGLRRRVEKGTSWALIGVHDETFFGQAASEPMRRGSTSGTGRGSSPGHGAAILAIRSFQTTPLAFGAHRACSDGATWLSCAGAGHGFMVSRMTFSRGKFGPDALRSVRR